MCCTAILLLYKTSCYPVWVLSKDTVKTPSLCVFCCMSYLQVLNLDEQPPAPLILERRTGATKGSLPFNEGLPPVQRHSQSTLQITDILCLPLSNTFTGSLGSRPTTHSDGRAHSRPVFISSRLPNSPLFLIWGIIPKLQIASSSARDSSSKLDTRP